MKRTKVLLCALTLSVANLVTPSARAQGLSFTADNPTVSQDFNSMGTSLTLPDGWKVERNTSAPRTLGSYNDASVDVMYEGGISLASNAKNGTWNFGASSDAGDRAIGGLTTTVANGTRCVNLMTAITNNHAEDYTITSLDINYQIENYRTCANNAGFAVQLYTSPDGVVWTAAGDSFYTLLDKTTDTATGSANVPITETPVSGTLEGLKVKGGNTLYLAWNISVASGTTPDKSPGLSIDDISLTAHFEKPEEEAPEPQLLLTQSTPTISENFDNMMEDGAPSLALPDCWRVDRRLHSDGDDVWFRPYYTASNEVMYTGGVSLASNAKNGSYSFGPSETSNDRAIGGLSTGSGTNGGVSTKCINLMTELTNGDETKPITSLTISYDIEKYRKGSNSNGFDVQLYYSADGSNWTSAGVDFLTHFAPDSETAGAAVVPISTTEVRNSRLFTEVAPGKKIYLAWHIAVGNHVKEASAAQGLAIDNIQITASYADPEEVVPTEILIKPASAVLVPAIPEKVRVLSLNNSLIDYNDQYLMFNNIANAMGKNATWTKHTNLGQPLSYHFNETGDNSARNVVASEMWTHIILQEHSSLPRTDIETFRANVKAWVDYIRANCPNPNAVIILPMNWAYNADSWNHFTEDNAALHANYVDVATDLGVTICPVADAYQLYYNDKDTATDALYSDNRHPKAAASYMAACMEYSLIFGESATDITFTPASVTDADMAADMRAYAAAALAAFENPVDHNAGTIRYSTAVIDQFGRVIPEAEATLSASKGTVNGNVYTTDGTLGDVTINAAYGNDITATATVNVAEAVVPAPLEEALVVHGYLNLNFKNLHFEGETDADNRTICVGAPYTVTLGVNGTVVYQIDYSVASNIVGAPKPQIWMNGFKSLTDEGAGFYSYTFPGTYDQGDEIQFSRYVANAVDDNAKIILRGNDPIVIGEPASLKLYVSNDHTLGNETVNVSAAVLDSNNRNINNHGTVSFTASEGASVNGYTVSLSDKGTYTVTATLDALNANSTLTRHAPAGLENIASTGTLTADDAVTNDLKLAVDGNISTQTVWTIGAKNEEHWLDLDLGRLCKISGITLVWEGASATVYDLNLSKDGETVTDTNEVPNGEYGDGRTIYKDFDKYSTDPVNARYLHLRTHTVYNAGYGMKLKEICVYATEIEPLSFKIENVTFTHGTDKSVTMSCTINHSNYDEVASYDIWAVDMTSVAAESPLKAPAAGDNDSDGAYVVGVANVETDASSPSKITATIPLSHLLLDDNVHTIAVRAKANLTDGSTLNSAAWQEGDTAGATGNESHSVDTSLSDCTTGIEGITIGNMNPVYYNMQGIRVENPGHGVYIRVTGNKVEKINIK